MSRIGVFVCQCGNNIASTVDTDKVSQELGGCQGVVYSEEAKFLCSSPGQERIKKVIKEQKLDGMVVAACSPHMHEKTFRKASEAAGLNPFRVEVANIREHCSWVHPDKTKKIGTEKSIDISKMTVGRVRQNDILDKIHVPITKKALVIGGGVAGIQAALDIAEGGQEVILLEKEESIGGRMAQLSETFPTMDCSQCILTPKMVEASQHENITILTFSELESIDGYVGNFRVTIRKKAKSVIESLCTECGACIEKCPFSFDNEFEMNMSKRKTFSVPFPQAVPNIPVINRDTCPKYTQDMKKCGVCVRVCDPDCIDFDQQDEIITEEIGAVVVATGFDVMPVERFPEYGGGKYKDVITGLHFERLASSSGPTAGEIKRISNGEVAKNIVFIECAGSRDESKGVSYCSDICCMYTAKHSMLHRHKVEDGQSYIFYMDIRCGGKRYEEFHRRAVEHDGAMYLRGRVARVYEKGDKLIVQGADTLTGSQIEIEADMVVLATAVVPRIGSLDLAQMLGIGYDNYGFYSEYHPKLKPVETTTAGIFIAGACIGPMDIPTAVAQGSATASKVLGLFSSDQLAREPQVAKVESATCNACWDCIISCPYGAIVKAQVTDRQGNLVKAIAKVNEGVCMGCGICVSACHSKTIDLKGYTDSQVFAALAAV